MELAYCGPAIQLGQVVPLPEGWPAYDHEDANEARAAAKLASGFYTEVKTLVVDEVAGTPLPEFDPEHPEIEHAVEGLAPETVTVNGKEATVTVTDPAASRARKKE